ncbi:MAG: DUF1648 domain-containing protein [Armatimonas sp.]
MRNPRFWLVLGALACVVHLWVNYPALPERMASHFGSDGHADGWMTKASIAQFQLGMTGFMAFLFLGLSKLLNILPADVINMPNREYWLSPARRAATIDMLGAEMARFGTILMVFLLGVQEATFRANINHTYKLGPLFFVCLFGFLGFTVVWLIGFYRRFRVR